jgi:hypothetical protein
MEFLITNTTWILAALLRSGYLQGCGLIDFAR